LFIWFLDTAQRNWSVNYCQIHISVKEGGPRASYSVLLMPSTEDICYYINDLEEYQYLAFSKYSTNHTFIYSSALQRLIAGY
jgi:hypothetical protein